MSISRLRTSVVVAWVNSLFLSVAGGIWILSANEDVIRSLVVDYSSVTPAAIVAVGGGILVIWTLGLVTFLGFFRLSLGLPQLREEELVLEMLREVGEEGFLREEGLMRTEEALMRVREALEERARMSEQAAEQRPGKD